MHRRNLRKMKHRHWSLLLSCLPSLISCKVTGSMHFEDFRVCHRLSASNMCETDVPTLASGSQNIATSALIKNSLENMTVTFDLYLKTSQGTKVKVSSSTALTKGGTAGTRVFASFGTVDGKAFLDGIYEVQLTVDAPGKSVSGRHSVSIGTAMSLSGDEVAQTAGIVPLNPGRYRFQSGSVKVNGQFLPLQIQGNAEIEIKQFEGDLWHVREHGQFSFRVGLTDYGPYNCDADPSVYVFTRNPAGNLEQGRQIHDGCPDRSGGARQKQNEVHTHAIMSTGPGTWKWNKVTKLADGAVREAERVFVSK